MITRARKIRITRLSTQLTALVVLNLQFLNALFPRLGFEGWRYACAPVFFCHSCPWATLACPLGVIVNFSRLGLFPFIAIGLLGLVGTFGGRIICGWVCPFGFLQEWLHKIPTRKFSLPRGLNYVKYAVLVLFVIAVPYFFNAPTSKLYSYTFCDGCPSATLESTIPWAIVGHWDVKSGLFGGFTPRFFTRMGILVGVIALAVFFSRGFCRMLCPLGAMFALFNRFSLFRFNLKFEKCNSCGGCAKVCPVEIDPVSEMNTAECIRCYDCTRNRHIGMGVK